MLGTLIAPDLGEIFFTISTPVRRVSLADAWDGRASALVAEPCPDLPGSSNGGCPYTTLGRGRLALALARRDEARRAVLVQGDAVTVFERI